jgi:hypothetical protein
VRDWHVSSPMPASLAIAAGVLLQMLIELLVMRDQPGLWRRTLAPHRVTPFV